jgi:hypothetical protein
MSASERERETKTYHKRQVLLALHKHTLWFGRAKKDENVFWSSKATGSSSRDTRDAKEGRKGLATEASPGGRHDTRGNTTEREREWFVVQHDKAVGAVLLKENTDLSKQAQEYQPRG